MERENLAGDAKGKGTSGSNREAESTDAPERGGLPRSSDEAGVMPVERRGRVIAVELGPTGSHREEPEGSAEGGSLRAVTRAGGFAGFKPGCVRASGGKSPGLLGKPG